MSQTALARKQVQDRPYPTDTKAYRSADDTLHNTNKTSENEALDAGGQVSQGSRSMQSLRVVRGGTSEGGSGLEKTATVCPDEGTFAGRQEQRFASENTYVDAFLAKDQNTTAGQPVRRRLVWKLALIASGQIGAAILSLTALWTILTLSGCAGGWMYEALLGLAILRVGYFHTRGPKAVLEQRQVWKRLPRLLTDETAISIGLAASCFVMSWSVELSTLGIFYLGSIILQLCLMSMSRFVITTMASYDKMGGHTEVATQQAIIVGTGAHARKVADMVLRSPELETRLLGFLDYRKKGLWRYRDVPLIGHPDTLEEIVANTQVDALFWAVEPLDIPRAWDVLKTAEKMGVSVFAMPSVYDPKVARIRPSYINGMPAMIYRSVPEGRVALLCKSVLDRIGALLGLVLFAPVMIAVAAVVKANSKGPILFKQVRSGLNGKQFMLYKFRTMCSDAEGRKKELLEHNEMSGPVFKIASDPRVTDVGRFLRKYSLDELPQLFNVIAGNMSLVGPRPPLPAEVRKFEPWQHRKLSVKPGLTCLWQVNGRNAIDFEDWMRLDLQYIDNWSLWLDAKILAKTIPAVMKGSGK